MDLKSISEKILKILRIRASIGGLEISDSSLRYAIFLDDRWLTTSLRLPPGLMENNQIKDKEQFSAALKDFGAQIKDLTKIRSKINVMVSLSSINIYSQVFNLPVLSKEEEMEKAIQLNIQMISPGESSQNYSSWQILNKKTSGMRFEILSVFINKQVVNEIISALKKAEFFPLAIESRSLSIARLIRQAASGINLGKVYLAMLIDSSGIDLITLENGYPYFEYFNSWRQLQGEERQITFENFQASIVRNFEQVLNFYSTHFNKNIDGVILATTGLKEEVKDIIQKNFPFQPKELVLPGGENIDSNWYIVLGCALRGMSSLAKKENEINLLGLDIQEEFQKQQLINFLNFWRVLLPATLAVLLVAVIGAKIFAGQIGASLVEQQNSLHISPAQLQNMNALTAQVNQFNQSVSLIKNIQKTTVLKSPLLQKLNTLAQKDNITLTSLVYQGAGVPVNLGGGAGQQEQIIAFKQDLQNDPAFSSVNLPLSSIQISSHGFVFSLTFIFNGSTID
jgi:Tfp pilus assembly PilM family ATPase